MYIRTEAVMEINKIRETAKNTPLYIFDMDRLSERTEKIRQILGGNGLCFAIKANPFL